MPIIPRSLTYLYVETTLKTPINDMITLLLVNIRLQLNDNCNIIEAHFNVSQLHKGILRISPIPGADFLYTIPDIDDLLHQERIAIIVRYHMVVVTKEKVDYLKGYGGSMDPNANFY